MALFYFMCVLHFLYPFICWWTLKLLPFPSIVNNVALSIGVHVYFLISVFFSPNIYPGVELLNHLVVIFLDFEKLPHCLPQWLHQFTFSPAVYQGSLFSIASAGAVTCLLFADHHSDRCEVILWFWFALPWWLWVLNTFSYTCWTFVCLLLRNVC